MPRIESTPPSPRPFRAGEYIAAVVAAWLIPGAGHFLLGYRARGVVLGVSILGLFWTGEAVLARKVDEYGRGRPLAVSREVSPIFFWAQAANGLSTLAANHLWGEPELPATNARIDTDLPRHLNLGILCTLLAGLLNALLILHVLDPRAWAEARAAAAVDARPGGDRGGGSPARREEGG
jgi:TM2 domain-containing membrane protein YozV